MNPMAADETSHEPSAAPAGPPPKPVASVARERRDDLLTGLPLLRYRFAGLPTLRPEDPTPAGAWRVLRAETRDGTTTLDLETHAGATSLADDVAAIDDAAAAAALATLAEARADGRVHGDLGAHRLWRRGDRVWVEGYGVPWREGATVEDDARALATDLLTIAGTSLGASMRARLAAVRDAGEPPAAPPPPAGASPTPPAPPHAPAPAVPTPTPALAPPAPPPRPSIPDPDPSLPLEAAAPDAAQPRLVKGAPPGAKVRRGATHAWQRAARDIGHTWHAATAAAGDVASAGAARAIRLLRRGGPAATASPHRGGAGDAPARRLAAGIRLPAGVTRRHALMALSLVVAAGAWLGLASWSPPVPAGAAFVSRVVGHVVDVRVEPPGLPPVRLVVVESPTGSRLPPGTVVGSVPSKVLLDRDGVWRFQAQFGGSSSHTVVLLAPDEPLLVVPFPSPPPATAP
jgi:hypothetical protein